ncbi:MAG: double-strand break repair helicase AddA [Pseudomonadota bacterium]
MSGVIVTPDDDTLRKQALAADPKNSAWVSANAGSGKTYVLATRVIRLLLAGVDPSKLLCLTFTKTAAAEMKTRVFDRLATWVTMDASDLKKELTKVDGAKPSDGKIRFARTLFASALETPGGLKIQTIHAFCEALLHRFPLEANIAGHFELLDDAGAEAMLMRARQYVLSGRGRSTELAQTVDDVLSEKGETAFNELLAAIVSKRRELREFLARYDKSKLPSVYRNAFGLSADVTREALYESAWPLDWFDQSNLQALADEANSNDRKTLITFCQRVYESTKLEPVERFALLFKAFTVDGKKEKGEPPKKPRVGGMGNKDVKAAFPRFHDSLQSAADKLIAIHDALTKLDEIDRNMQMLTVADALIGRYEDLKRAQGYLDFNDLIARTADMLKRQGSSAWVRYKLDQGIDHILVDEAQDTSPLQWDVIRTFADEFFDGEAARTEKRTVFAVGDDKQSIYSFQGADPIGFDTARTHFGEKVAGAEKAFEPVVLDRSFRSAINVLDAVDRVFAVPENRQGLTQTELYPAHTALRSDTPGHVAVWEVCTSEPEPDLPENWADPIDRAAPGARLLAQRIANRIADWLSERAPLAVQGGRQVKADDIVILVRKRGPLVGELSAELKGSGVPVAGADRLVLTSHIAVMDLLALGKCLLNTHDELSLAAVLKSPLFGFHDNDLMRLCIDREQETLWQRLATSHEARDRQASENLIALRVVATTCTAFSFFAHVLSAKGGREKFIARLNPETPDILDEFLASAIAFDREQGGSLHLFIDHLERNAPEVKREMEQDSEAVRIMTVHGAKGLEAPVVFLVDDCTAPHNAGKTDRVVMLQPNTLANEMTHPLPAWNRGGARSSIMEAVADAKRDADEEEYRRLLYVGMTRAADALYVVGHTTKQEPPKPGDLRWHQMVLSALQDSAEETEAGGYSEFLFPSGTKQVAAVSTQSPAIEPNEAIDMAGRAKRVASKAPYEPPPKRPLIPSGATSFAIDALQPAEAVEAANVPSLLGGHEISNGASAAQRGIVLHTLLQMLPDVEPQSRRDMGRQWLTRNGVVHEAQQSLLDEVFSVIDDSANARIFAENSRAEAQIMGTIEVTGEERGVSGVIDRIAISQGVVTVLDYKTGRPPYDNQPPPVAVYQLALYGALVQKLYPDHKIETLLLFTQGPRLIEVPPEAREKALDDLAKA